MDFIGYKKICKKFWNSKTRNLGYKKGKDSKKLKKKVQQDMSTKFSGLNLYVHTICCT